MKVIKTSKSQYGWYIQLEDSSYKGCTEDVSNFIKSKIPCDIEVESTEGEGKQEKVNRIKILGSSTQSEAPVETVKPGHLVTEPVPASNFTDNRQNSIECQMSIKTAVDMISANNAVDEFEKMRPTKDNIFQTAKIVLEVLKDLKNL